MDYFPLTLEQLLALVWHKADSSTGGGNCVEVANVPDGRVAVRDSKDRSGPMLVFTPNQWDDFIAGVAVGDLDG
ncbi:DUF397 domain-containing protein [Nocardia testacea]|uniref:DUF397 domain-containing protein n=1 Tax=Nocardia testacea TaxID=248551 RepID=UPI003A8A812D